MSKVPDSPGHYPSLIGAETKTQRSGVLHAYDSFLFTVSSSAAAGRYRRKASGTPACTGLNLKD
jgi:hypothetical protein